MPSFIFHRVPMLDSLLSPYYRGKKRVLIKLVDKAWKFLGPICLAALQMDSEEIWVVGNVLLQCMEKCYYLIDILWHFVINTHHYFHLSTDLSCILDICIALNELLLFIQQRLHSVGNKNIDCTWCLLTLKHQVPLYTKVFCKIRALKLDAYVSASFNHSLTYLSHQI